MANSLVCTNYEANLKEYNSYGFKNIIDKLKSCEHYNSETKTLVIDTFGLEELFYRNDYNIKEIIKILGRNKITYKKYQHRKFEEGKRIVIKNTYTFFLE